MPCPRCGVSNGNRAYACKACHCPLKTQHLQCKRRRDASDVTELLPGDIVPSPKRVFSVRLRKAGPDYRTLVTEDSSSAWKCRAETCSVAQEGRLRSGTSINDASQSNKQQPGSQLCRHIQCVQTEVAHEPVETALYLDPQVLDTLPFPDKTRKTLLSMHGTGKAMILRVSEDTFAVRSGKTCQQHPPGILHVRVSKRLSLNGDTSDPTASGLSLPPSQAIYCPCHSHISRQGAGGPATARLSKRCIHLYLCLWAFASDKTLAKEFCVFLKGKH